MAGSIERSTFPATEAVARMRAERDRQLRDAEAERAKHEAAEVQDAMVRGLAQKFCRDCKWAVNGPLENFCENPGVNERYVPWLSDRAGMRCVDARGAGPCGMDARFFEQEEAP